MRHIDGENTSIYCWSSLEEHQFHQRELRLFHSFARQTSPESCPPTIPCRHRDARPGYNRRALHLRSAAAGRYQLRPFKPITINDRRGIDGFLPGEFLTAQSCDRLI